MDVLVKPVVPQRGLSERAVDIRIFERDMKLASIDDLITMKAKAGRPKDLIDMDALERIKRGEDPNG